MKSLVKCLSVVYLCDCKKRVLVNSVLLLLISSTGNNVSRMDISDYSGQNWNGEIIDKFKKELSKWKNDKERLKNIFRPRQYISLFHEAVEHDADFAAYLIQFAIDNKVDSWCFQLGERRNSQLVEVIMKYAADQGTDIRFMIFFTFGLEKVTNRHRCTLLQRKETQKQPLRSCKKLRNLAERRLRHFWHRMNVEERRFDWHYNTCMGVKVQEKSLCDLHWRLESTGER